MLQRLLVHPNRHNFEIATLVRNAEKAKRLETEFGVKVALGSLQDLDKLASLSEDAHVVIHTVRRLRIGQSVAGSPLTFCGIGRPTATT